jgi:hypothetical protein
MHGGGIEIPQQESTLPDVSWQKPAFLREIGLFLSASAHFGYAFTGGRFSATM